MSLFKCKMCGGDLEVNEGVTIAECEYCGTKQTMPKAMDENLQNLFNRANTLRIKSEFDKAEKLYEKIIQADTTQSEAYWGLILCKYGIEYVDDPSTFKKTPTCHRASYDSIIADDDYKSAIENADMSQRAIYEEQAKEIDRIQKDILTLAQKEESYDVFICYKETDANGQRTQDSVIANDIYYQLTQEGFKVFYAAITLEGKLGSAYEPIIFAALNSAKVMLSIGTKPEYFNAVWVKNEWSRYLKIIKKDRSKLLIPCYRDMDAYELPEEFAHLQAQDMAKIGFINDLVRGIKKVIKKDNPKASVVNETVITSQNANTDSLLKRAFMFLEDGDWNNADEYCEKVLDIDPENGQAYLGKLLVENKKRSKEQLSNCKEPFDSSNYYQKILRFGSSDLIKELKQCNITIRERNEENRKADIYNKGVNLANQQTPKEQIKAAQEFEKIRNYRDADARAKECRNKALQLSYDNAVRQAEAATTSQQYKAASQLFFAISNYPPAKEKAEECIAKSAELAEIERKDAIYCEAVDAMEVPDISAIKSAIESFQSIITWRDSESKIDECNKRIAKIEEEQEQKRIADEQANKKMNIIFAVVSFCTCIFIVFIIIINTVIIPNGKYNDAVALMNEGEYADALAIFEELDGYKDSLRWKRHCELSIEEIAEKKAQQEYERQKSSYDNAIQLMYQQDYGEAAKIFETILSFENSDRLFECCSNAANGKYSSVIDYWGLTTFTVPNGVTTISAFSFSDCTELTSITIPDSVTSIGEGAFNECRGLTSITIPDSVTSIGKHAFSDCTGLTSVTIGNGVTSIGDYAFSYCRGLTSVTFENTNGWYIHYGFGEKKSISSNSLANTSTAADYLRSTYSSYSWERS